MDEKGIEKGGENQRDRGREEERKSMNWGWGKGKKKNIRKKEGFSKGKNTRISGGNKDKTMN